MNKMIFKNIYKVIFVTVIFGLMPSSSFAYTFTQSLQKGVSGTEVRELQTALKTDPSIYPEGIVSGIFGALTEKAVQRFQVKYNIASAGTGYGVVGPKTRAKLNEIFSAPLLEISGWIPYWRKATGTAEAIVHIDTFREINPFGYTVKTDGTLFDAAKIAEDPWPALFATARAKKVRVVPTVMWANGEAMHRILSNTKTRIALEDEIAAVVKQNNFDGIDIDFEGKLAETKPYFSTFLKGLYMRMGKKWVMCTIEARTPLDSRYDTIPKDIQYANDFNAINSYCDRVRIMAYDQGSIDLRLNEAEPGPYVPVADPKWVEKVITLAAKTISKKKLVIGIPTYGYEYEITKLSEDGYRYDMLWALNPKYAIDLAAELNIKPERNSAGELSFLYTPSQNTATSAPLVAGAATSTGAVSLPPRIVWWSDASAIKDKVTLAKKIGVRGVAIFKIDGGADPAMWDALR